MTAAAVTNLGGVLAQTTASADAAGYQQLLDFADRHVPGRRLWAVAVLGRWMAAAALVVCVVVFAVGVARGEPREVGHPPAVLKVPPSTGRMALVHRPRSGQAAAWGG